MNYFYKTKFLQIISLCVLMCHFTNVAAMNQVEEFKKFADQSWKSKKIPLNNSSGASSSSSGAGGGGGGATVAASGGGGSGSSSGGGPKTIEEHLVDEFKSKEWGPLNLQLIDKQLVNIQKLLTRHFRAQVTIAKKMLDYRLVQYHIQGSEQVKFIKTSDWHCNTVQQLELLLKQSLGVSATTAEEKTGWYFLQYEDAQKRSTIMVIDQKWLDRILKTKIYPVVNNNDLINYYNGTLKNPAAGPDGNYDPDNPEDWNDWRSDPGNDLAPDDSPRQWKDKLNLREIYRFKEFVSKTANADLINNAHYATDDLVKARSLCGVFYIVDTTGDKNAEKGFSGMLEPNQLLNSNNFTVHTCGHGFADGNSNNNVAYYFVPYGVEAESNPYLKGRTSNPNYVTKKGFKVTAVKLGRGNVLPIDNEHFKKENIVKVEQYAEDDYAVATIENHADAMSLKDVLKGVMVEKKPLNIVTEGSERLPNLNVAVASDGPFTTINEDTLFSPENNERLFVIGLGLESDMALDDSGLTVCTTTTNEMLADGPRRSLKDDENIKVPEDIGTKETETSSSLSSYYGMSGGPVLRCKLDPTNPKNKKCVFIGTIWGGERVFINPENTAGKDKLKEFKCFINKKL